MIYCKNKRSTLSRIRLAAFAMAALLSVMLILGAAAPSSKVPVPPCPQVGIVVFPFHGMASSGSCSLVAKDVILTCCHVIRGSEATVLIDGQKRTAKLIAMDFKNDWCLMRLDKSLDMSPLKVSPDVPSEGEKLYGFGFGPYSQGRWGCNRLVYRGGKVWGRFHSGDSGGPLCNSDGDVVGVCTSYTESGYANGWSVGHVKGFVDKYKGHRGSPVVVE